jgi:hypothetical protein
MFPARKPVPMDPVPLIENKVAFVGIQEIHTPNTLSPGFSEAPPYTPNESRRALISRKVHGYVTKWWLAEFASVGVALLMLVAILIFLHFLDKRPYVGSTNGKANVYPILSFLNTITKAAMLMPVASAIAQLRWTWFQEERALSDLETFDEASRGFWGSVKLLFKLRLWSEFTFSLYFHFTNKP